MPLRPFQILFFNKEYSLFFIKFCWVADNFAMAGGVYTCDKMKSYEFLRKWQQVHMRLHLIKLEDSSMSLKFRLIIVLNLNNKLNVLMSISSFRGLIQLTSFNWKRKNMKTCFSENKIIRNNNAHLNKIANTLHRECFK